MKPRRALVLVAVLVGCKTHAVGMEAGGSSGSSADDALQDAALPSRSDAGTKLEPLAGEWMERLEFPEGEAYVAPPLGSMEPRPVIVAVHGAMDHPSYMCSAWRVIADAYAFIVCPAGRKARGEAGSLFVWSGGEPMSRQIDHALAAARKKFGARMIDAPMVYTAFSQGATLAAAPLVTDNRGRFTRAALIEGGYHTLEDANARAFKRAGGERVLYTCSQGGCVGAFGASKAALTAAGVPVRVESPGAYGHSMVPAVRASLNAALPWLTEGLAGWERYPASPKLDAH